MCGYEGMCCNVCSDLDISQCDGPYSSSLYVRMEDRGSGTHQCHLIWCGEKGSAVRSTGARDPVHLLHRTAQNGCRHEEPG